LEFWIYIGFHAGMVACFKYANLNLGNFRWEAAAAMQFFLMFMLIFYNGHCYERYLQFYAACMEVLRSAIFFIQELIISVPYDEVEKHRQVASRYILATIYLFYMNVTGGAAKGLEWQELRRKGLLTKDEAHMLSEYPGRVVLTLTSWAMQVVCKALDKDVFWEDQKPHIAHVHNRLNVHMINIIRGSNRVCYLLANPIPFLYFHLMNSILVVNFFVLGVAFAIFKTWMTLAAYGFAVLVYTGLRQVSIDLSEPFEQDASDFPVHQFLDYAFDHSVGLLEAFSHPEAYDVVMDSIPKTTPFDNEELVRSATQPVQFNFGDGKGNPFEWHKQMPFQQMGDTRKKHLKRALTHLLVGVGALRDAQEDLDEHHPDPNSRYELLTERRKAATKLRQELEAARIYLSDLKEISSCHARGEPSPFDENGTRIPTVTMLADGPVAAPGMLRRGSSFNLGGGKPALRRQGSAVSQAIEKAVLERKTSATALAEEGAENVVTTDLMMTHKDSLNLLTRSETEKATRGAPGAKKKFQPSSNHGAPPPEALPPQSVKHPGVLPPGVRPPQSAKHPGALPPGENLSSDDEPSKFGNFDEKLLKMRETMEKTRPDLIRRRTRQARGQEV